MQIVIEIPDKDYQVTLTKIMLACHGCKITELPKSHGDLIDRDALELDAEWDAYYDAFCSYSQMQIDDASTIIEAEEN